MPKKDKEKQRPPSFQFYAKDWRDVKVRRMSLAAQGAYICILADMWIDSKDQCSVLDNDAFLARSVGIPRNEWEAIRAEIQNADEPLLSAKDGRLFSKRLQEESLKQKEYSRKQTFRIMKRWHTVVLPDEYREVYPTDTKTYSSSSLNTSSLSFPVPKKEPTKKEKRRRDLESFELTDELRNWAMQEFGVSIPDDVFQEFKDHWMKEPDAKLRINWTATFKTRIRQLVSWKTLVPKSQGLIDTCMFQEQQVEKNGRLPTYKPCGKPIAENSKKKLCADHIRAEQERLSRKPVLPLLQEETTT